MDHRLAIFQTGRRDLVSQILVTKYNRRVVSDPATEEEVRRLCKWLNTPFSDGSTFLSEYSKKILTTEDGETTRLALEIILECGADPDMLVPATGLRPGHTAVLTGTLWAARLMLLAGMDVTLKSEDENSTSVLALASRKCPKFAEIIVSGNSFKRLL
jgi:hypothetical protein